MKFMVAPLAIIMSLNAHSKELSLDNYLKEIENQNQTIRASQSTIDGVEKRSKESELIFKTNYFLQSQALIDKKPTASVAAQGDRTDNQYVSTGLMKQFDFGLKGKLSYTLSHTHIYNASSLYLPLSNFDDSQIGIELTQSLWRNFKGTEFKSQSTILDADVAAKKLIESYKTKVILSKAESVYWSLSQMKKMVQVQKENLERAKKIKVWAEERSNSGLGDKSDLLQSDANVKYREYELKSSEQQLKTIARAFNNLRNLEGDEVNEQLSFINSNLISNLKLQKKSDLREDTKAAMEYEKLTKANLDLSIEKNKPNLELYGSYALNGRDREFSNSITNGTKTDKTTIAIGVRFNMPIDLGLLNDNIEGYKKEKVAAELNLKQKIFDQDQEWNDLVSKFNDAKENLALAEKIETAQKLKSTNERDRLTKGRTTTFQVLNFEQDYATSELLKLKFELEIINLYSQSKTFLTGGQQ
jgi:outer membrane protein TolC